MPSPRKPSPKRSTLDGLPTYANAVERMTTKSVMSPLLWCAVIFVVVLMSAAYLMPETRQSLVTLTFIVVTFVLVIYAYFALRDPDRLQSEEYQIEAQQIKLLRESGKEPATIELTANTISNPNAPPQLEGRSSK